MVPAGHSRNLITCTAVYSCPTAVHVFRSHQTVMRVSLVVLGPANTSVLVSDQRGTTAPRNGAGFFIHRGFQCTRLTTSLCSDFDDTKDAIYFAVI